MCRILVVDDEEEVRDRIVRRLSRENIFKVSSADSAKSGTELILKADPPYDIVITDMVMESEDSGIELLQAALGQDIFTEVIVLTAYGTVANAVEAMKRGAFDYVEKNIPGVDVYELLLIKIQQAMERRRSSINTLRRMDRQQRKQ